MNLSILLLAAAISLTSAVPLEKQAERKCGVPVIKPDTSTDIVGGKDAIPYSWPWQVHLVLDGRWWCGATLITNQWVLTAKHCVEGNGPKAFRVKLGVFNKLKNDEPGEVIADVTEIHNHPTYNISLMKLSSPVEFTDHIIPICLPTQDEQLPAVGTNVFTVGWGNTKLPSSVDSNTLKQVAMPLVSDQKCEAAIKHKRFDSKTELCIGFENGNKTVCHGDSGGSALVQIEDGSWKQIGITYYVQNLSCLQPGYSGFTKVAYFLDFIKQYVHDLE